MGSKENVEAKDEVAVVFAGAASAAGAAGGAGDDSSMAVAAFIFQQTIASPVFTWSKSTHSCVQPSSLSSEESSSTISLESYLTW